MFHRSWNLEMKVYQDKPILGGWIMFHEVSIMCFRGSVMQYDTICCSMMLDNVNVCSIIF